MWVELEHCLVPGTQVPPHALLTHAYMQPVAVPQAPLLLHVWMCVLSEHCVLPGTQVPPQALLTHAYMHDVAVPH